MRTRPDSSWSDEQAMEMFRAGHSYNVIATCFQVFTRYVRNKVIDCRLTELEKQQALLEGRIRFLEAKKNGEELSRVKAHGFVMPSIDDSIINLYRAGRSIKDIGMAVRSTEGQVVQVLSRAKSHGLLNGAAVND